MKPIDLTNIALVRLLNNDPASWEALEDYFTGNGHSCNECRYFGRHSQRHAPGMVEHFTECDILDNNTAELQPCDCPAFAGGEIDLPEDGAPE